MLRLPLVTCTCERVRGVVGSVPRTTHTQQHTQPHPSHPVSCACSRELECQPVAELLIGLHSQRGSGRLDRRCKQEVVGAERKPKFPSDAKAATSGTCASAGPSGWADGRQVAAAGAVAQSADLKDCSHAVLVDVLAEPSIQLKLALGLPDADALPAGGRQHLSGGTGGSLFEIQKPFRRPFPQQQDPRARRATAVRT